MTEQLSVWALILGAGIVVKGVLLLLLLLSILSWGIIFNKWRIYRKSRKESASFSEKFWGGSDMDSILASIPKHYSNSPLPNIFQAGYREYNRQRHASKQAENNHKIVAGSGLDSIRRSLDAALSRELEALSSHLSFLATVGSTSPFIGLFGTVWGILTAFQGIAVSQNTSLTAVAPGIAEALVATAFGLVAAIPAVVAYNKFTADLKRQAAGMEQFSSEFLNIISRHLSRH